MRGSPKKIGLGLLILKKVLEERKFLSQDVIQK
jgi:hypothetical protein